MSTNKPQPLDQLKGYLHEKGLLIPLVFGIVGLLAGFIIAAVVVGSHSESTAKATPAAVKTVQAAPDTEYVVPEDCTQALDEADRGFSLAADMSSEFRDAIVAIQNGDLQGVQTATKNIESINSSLNNLSPDYNADKQACREAAEKP